MLTLIFFQMQERGKLKLGKLSHKDKGLRTNYKLTASNFSKNHPAMDSADSV